MSCNFKTFKNSHFLNSCCLESLYHVLGEFLLIFHIPYSYFFLVWEVPWFFLVEDWSYSVITSVFLTALLLPLSYSLVYKSISLPDWEFLLAGLFLTFPYPFLVEFWHSTWLIVCILIFFKCVKEENLSKTCNFKGEMKYRKENLKRWKIVKMVGWVSMSILALWKNSLKCLSKLWGKSYEKRWVFHFLFNMK